MVVILSKLLSDHFNNNIYLSALAFAKAAHGCPHNDVSSFAFQNSTFLGKHFLKPLPNAYFIFSASKSMFWFLKAETNAHYITLTFTLALIEYFLMCNA